MNARSYIMMSYIMHARCRDWQQHDRQFFKMLLDSLLMNFVAYFGLLSTF